MATNSGRLVLPSLAYKAFLYAEQVLSVDMLSAVVPLFSKYICDKDLLL